LKRLEGKKRGNAKKNKVARENWCSTHMGQGGESLGEGMEGGKNSSIRRGGPGTKVD